MTDSANDSKRKAKPDAATSDGYDELVGRPGWDDREEFEYKGYGDQGAFGQSTGADDHDPESKPERERTTSQPKPPFKKGRSVQPRRAAK